MSVLTFSFFFWKGEETIKNGKCQLLKMARSPYIVILIKSSKDLDLSGYKVSSASYRSEVNQMSTRHFWELSGKK